MSVLFEGVLTAPEIPQRQKPGDEKAENSKELNDDRREQTNEAGLTLVVVEKKKSRRGGRHSRRPF